MKKLICLLTTILIGVSLNAQTYIPGGSVEGTWNLEGSPYIILGDIEINYSNTLIIEPGVEVRFNWSFTLFVNGTILAQGTEADSITFTAVDLDQGWESIRFLDTPLDNDSSRFEYCIFKHGKVYGSEPDNSGGAIAAVNYGQFVIDNCMFKDNEALDSLNLNSTPCGAAIALLGTGIGPVITNSVFKNNIAMSGGSIFCYEDSDPWIENNTFFDNIAVIGSNFGSGFGGAITCYLDSDPTIINNTFYNNLAMEAGGAIAVVSNCNPVIQRNLIYSNTAKIWGGGIEVVDECSPKILNNTITHNTATSFANNAVGGGIDIWLNSSPEIKNNILWFNSADAGGSQVYINCEGTEPEFYNCNIQGGKDSIAGAECIVEYRDCIDCAPKFEDPVNGNYQITWASWPVNDSTKCQCIDAGAGGGDPDGTDYDIGALYFDQTPETPVAHEAINIHESGFTAGWDACAGAMEYRLDVAYDENFTNYAGVYEDFIVNNTSLEVENITGDCYYRVRAANPEVTSDNSNEVFVDIITSVREDPFNGNIRVITLSEGIRIEILNKEFSNSELSFYNMHGQKLLTRRLTIGSNYIPLDTQQQLLILCIRNENKTYAEKIMLRR